MARGMDSAAKNSGGRRKAFAAQGDDSDDQKNQCRYG